MNFSKVAHTDSGTKTPMPKRITLKSISEWVTAELVRLEIPFKVVDIYRTRLTSSQYECGAAKLIITILRDGLDERYSHSLYSFYSIADFKYELDKFKGASFHLHIELISGAYINFEKSYLTLK